MLKIARSGFTASRLSSEQARSSPQALLRCRAIGAHVYDACSQALRSFALQANTQFSTLRSLTIVYHKKTALAMGCPFSFCLCVFSPICSMPFVICY
jgi:hypothetical protein